MQRRNCVAGEIAETCQPFKLAVFPNFPLSIAFAFSKLRASKMSSELELFPSLLSPLLRLRLNSLPATQWPGGLGVWVCIVTSSVALLCGSIPSVAQGSFIADSPTSTRLVVV